MSDRREIDFTDELFKAIPKAELHVHLDGSIRPATVVELAEEYGVELPAYSAEAISALVRPPLDSPSLPKYLAAFDIMCSVLKSPEAIYRVTTELLEDLSSDGVRYAELRYSTRVLPGDVDPSEAIDAVGRAISDAESRLNIKSNQILCIMRHETPAVGRTIAELAVRHRNDRVVGIDIAGAEAGNPPELHRASFDFARKYGLFATVHAGEAGPAEYIRDSVVMLGAQRIGHGTRLTDSPLWMRAAADQRICIEACLTSNVQTGAVASMRDHPLPQFLNGDVPVTLSTDNVTVSGVTLSEEYRNAYDTFALTASQIAKLALTGFEHAFLPVTEKRVLLNEARESLHLLLATGPR